MASADLADAMAKVKPASASHEITKRPIGTAAAQPVAVIAPESNANATVTAVGTSEKANVATNQKNRPEQAQPHVIP